MKGLPLDCSVIDATAGFGRDALELATVSNSVVLIERIPWLHYLLQDGIKNSTEEHVVSLVNKFELIQSDARDFFRFLRQMKLTLFILIQCSLIQEVLEQKRIFRL